MKRQADDAQENIRRKLSLDTGHRALSLVEIKELSEAFHIIDEHSIRLTANDDDEMVFVFPISSNSSLLDNWWDNEFDDQLSQQENDDENAHVETAAVFKAKFGVDRDEVKYILITAEANLELFRDMGDSIMEFYPQDRYEFSASEDSAVSAKEYLFKRTTFTGLLKAFYKRQ